MKIKKSKKLDGVWFDKNNQIVIKDGKALRKIEEGEELFYYGRVVIL
jgi:hypothetical protein